SHDADRSAAAQGDLPQAVPHETDAGLLLVVPQSAPRRAGEQLPLVPRLQRLRQLAGLGHFRRRRAVLLLPEGVAEEWRLPHAADPLQRSRGAATRPPLGT